jgi:hypothetical protein
MTAMAAMRKSNVWLLRRGDGGVISGQSMVSGNSLPHSFRFCFFEVPGSLERLKTEADAVPESRT